MRIYINDDLPGEIKKQQSDLRAIATHTHHLKANALVKGETLILNNAKYKHEELDLLPARFSLASAKTPQTHPCCCGLSKSRIFPLKLLPM